MSARKGTLHVALIVPSFSADSSMQIPSIALLAHGLSAAARITVFPLRNPPDLSHGHTGGLEIVDIGGARLRLRRLVQRATQALLAHHREAPFDVLHGYWLFEPGLVASTVGRIVGVPAVASIGGAELTDLSRLSYGGYRTLRGKALNRATLATADIVTGGSHYVLEQARRVSPRARSRLRLAPLPVRLPTGTEPVSSPFTDSDAFQLLQVGAYLPVKGQDLSIRAFASLANDWPNLRLTMIGEDPYRRQRRLRQLAFSLGIERRLRMIDRIPHDDLTAYYQHSDLLLMPSRHESQGMTVLEGASHSLPTVGSRVGVVADLAPGGAVAVPVDDYQALASAIRELLASPDERFRLGAGARRAVGERYAEGPAVERWLSIYEEARRGR